MCWVLRVKNNLIASDTGYIWPSACLQLSREPPPSLESQRFPTILARAPLFQHPPASAFSSLPTLCDLLLWRAKFWLAPPRIDFAPASLCVLHAVGARGTFVCVEHAHLYLYTCTRLFPIIYILCGVRPAPARPSFSLFIWYERRKRISVHPRLGFCCLRSLTSPPNPPPNCALALSLSLYFTRGEWTCIDSRWHTKNASCNCFVRIMTSQHFFYISGQMLLIVIFAIISKRILYIYFLLAVYFSLSPFFLVNKLCVWIYRVV